MHDQPATRRRVTPAWRLTGTHLCGIALCLLAGCQRGGDEEETVDLVRQEVPVDDDGASSADEELAPDASSEATICVKSGCACADGTAPRACESTPTYTDAGVKICESGQMYCRTSRWTECLSLSGLVLE
jgi:hypothetical protein